MNKITGTKPKALTLRQTAEEHLKQKQVKPRPESSGIELMKLFHELELQKIELELQNEELIQAKEAADVATQKYSALYNFAPSGYCTLTDLGEIVELNPSAANMLGKNSKLLINSRFGFFVSDDTKKRFNLFLNNVFHIQTEQLCEVTLLNEGSSPKTVYLIGLVSKNIEHCYVNIVDITEKKQAEELLKESEFKFRDLVSDMQVGVLLQSSDSKILLSNPKAIELLGISENQLLGKTSFDPDWNVIHEDGSPFPGHTHPVPHAIATRQSVHDVIMGVYRPSLGDRVWLKVDAELQFNKDESIRQVVCSFIDITERKKAEAELSKQNNLFNTLLKNLKIGVYMIEVPSGKPILANDESFNLLGRGILPEAHSSTISKVYDLYKSGSGLPYPNEELPLVEAMNGVSKHVDDMFVVKPDGEITELEVFGSPIIDDKGKIWASLVSFQDITERKKTDWQLKRKMTELTDAYKQLDQYFSDNQELKQFAYISSHQLQQPLRTISNYIQIIEEEYSGILDSNALKHLNTVKDSTDRMNSLILALSDYSRLGQNRILQSVDCKILMNDVIADLQSVIETSDVRIEVSEMPVLKGYEVELRQVFQNLLSNAIKYQNKGSRPEIKIGSEKINGMWQFYVKDNGIGIPTDNHEKIFNIFQRMHINEEEYEGKGIGLAFCKKIVELHQGKIWVESTLGLGTTAYFTIPNLIM
jgi:PAS domain S-box-containing protein